MANRSIWYEVGVAIRKLFFSGNTAAQQTNRKTSQPKPQSKSQPTSQAKSQSGSKPHLKQSSDSNRSNGSAAEFDGSPGQHGEGQTRDITSVELRHLKFEYAPRPDGDPDPGEVVWTWVPYVENDGRGKDRPVLIIGRIDQDTVVGCYLSTKQHRDYLPIGTGAWDPQRRESFLSPERLLRVTHDGMRREGVQIDRARFESAVRGVLTHHGLK